MKSFQKIYPFATENVKDSLNLLDLEGKTVLTVGSSLDQAFDALVYGAKEVTVFDINQRTKEYYEYKSKLLLERTRLEFYASVLKENKSFIFDELTSKENLYQKTCKYLESDEQYELLRDKLKTQKINFINGNILDMSKSFNHETFDRMIFSNILQYLEYFVSKNENCYQVLKETFNIWKTHLNPAGIIEICYLYSVFNGDKPAIPPSIAIYNLFKVWESLQEKNLYLERVPSFSYNEKFNDGILTYRQ